MTTVRDKPRIPPERTPTMATFLMWLDPDMLWEMEKLRKMCYFVSKCDGPSTVSGAKGSKESAIVTLLSCARPGASPTRGSSRVLTVALKLLE
jgi:hypothetical protein